MNRDLIASHSNPGIKLIRSLQRRKIRLQERAFIVEGLRAVEDVLTAGVVPRALYVRDGFDVGEIGEMPVEVPIRPVLPALFDTLTDVPHPQGVLAVVPMLDEAAVPEPGPDRKPLVLIVDAVRDPGNLGTLLRSAAAAGADHVVIAPETVDPYHPKAVRSAMGAHVRIPFSHRSWEDMAAILHKYAVVALADADGEMVYDHIPWESASAVIVGGEAFGPSINARECANVRTSIPLSAGVESLNAGVAGSLLLFEAARQRRVANQ